MFQVLSIIFAGLALLLGLVGMTGKLFVTATNPKALTLAIVLLALIAAALSYYMRYRIARQSQTQIQTERAGGTNLFNSEVFWKWMSRISVVVSLIAGLFSIGRDVFAMI